MCLVFARISIQRPSNARSVGVSESVFIFSPPSLSCPGQLTRLLSKFSTSCLLQTFFASRELQCTNASQGVVQIPYVVCACGYSFISRQLQSISGNLRRSSGRSRKTIQSVHYRLLCIRSHCPPIQTLLRLLFLD